MKEEAHKVMEEADKVKEKVDQMKEKVGEKEEEKEVESWGKSSPSTEHWN